MLSNYIKNLLNTHSRVIVPDLGAFMLKGDSSQTIYFNEFLRFNDGLLVDYVAEQEKIDKLESAKKVKKYVDDINQQLSTTKSAEIKGIGVLFIDSNEKIQIQHPHLESQTQETPVQVEKDTARREILLEIENTETAAPTKPVSKPIKKTKAQTTTSQPEVDTPEKQTSTQTNITQPVTETHEKQAHKVSSEKANALSQPHLSTPEKPIKKITKSTNNYQLVWIGAGILLILGVIVYFVFFRTFSKETNVNQNITIGEKSLSDSTSSKDSISEVPKSPELKSKIKTSAKAKTETKEQTKSKFSKKEASEESSKISKPVSKTDMSKPLASITGKRYYLVAGCFSVESNANKMVSTLKNKGYQAEKFVTTKNNLYYVSYASYPDRDLATREMNRIKETGNLEIWILKR